jgi:hypothetical protein
MRFARLGSWPVENLHDGVSIMVSMPDAAERNDEWTGQNFSATSE